MLSLPLIFAALVVIFDVGSVTGSPVTRARRNEAGHGIGRTAHAVTAREARPQNGGISVVASDGASGNLTTACMDALSSMNSTNPTGLMGCWNILSLDNHNGMYQGDLRIYNASAPSAPFVGTSMTSTLSSAPMGTLMQQMSKRSEMVARQSTDGSGNGTGNGSGGGAGDGSADGTSNPPVDVVMQVFQGVFNGQINPSLDLSKLNNTELMALVIPQITITGVSSTGGPPVSANMTTSDMVFFVAGVFAGQSATADTVANNAAAIQLAMTAGTVFVMPGQTLGIFPTGLIITSAWCVLFITAVGVGTVGRIRHQSKFRSRMAANVGKR